MMPEKKHYSYTNLDDTPKHGEIIESSYLLGDRSPKSWWTRIGEVLFLLAIIGGCAYVLVVLFHNGNKHQSKNVGPQEPSRPVGASSSSMHDSASCADNAACMELKLEGDCCPTVDNTYLNCCPPRSPEN